MKSKHNLTKTFSLTLVILCLISVMSNKTESFSYLTAYGHIDTDSLIQSLTEKGDTNYIWSINQNNSWEDLHTFLLKAKIAGISVSVNLMPPSETPPLCSTCNPSEPYGNDYVRWAQEIARLSRRYSNLKGYTIEDLQENINLSYFSQNYIDSIETVGKTINPKLQFIIPDNSKNYYVDKYATGNGSGLDWKNAVTSLSLLSWTNIGDNLNDTIYVSGGSDSTTYSPVFLSLKRPAYQVVITHGLDSGHDGKVIFQNPNEAVGYTFIVSQCKNIKLTKITFNTVNTVDDSLHFYYIVRFGNSRDCVLDSCTVTSTGIGDCIYISADTNATITNNTIITYDNPYKSSCDNIHIDQGGYGKTITGNYMYEGGYGGYTHKDCIQFHVEGVTSGERPLVTIANNIMIHNQPTAPLGTGINYDESYSSRLLVYNNIMYINTAGSQCIVIQDNDYPVSAYVFNNTMIAAGGGNTNQYGRVDTLVMKNNILEMDATGTNIYFNNSGGYGYSWVIYKDIDNNLYYRFGGTRINTGSDLIFSEWQALSNDANGIEGKPVFDNKGGTTIVDYRLSDGSPGLGDGTDLSYYFTTDIEGTTRSGWNIGALEVK